MLKEERTFDLNSSLKSIGKGIFVEYFYEFKDCQDKNALAQRLLSENTKAHSKQAQATRVSNALRIFHENKEREALELIAQSTKVKQEIREKAEEIMAVYEKSP